MRVFTKYTLIALILLGLSFISMTSSKSGDKTCLDVNGKEVDWFVIFLYPTTSSPSDTLSYGYYDVNSKDIEFYEYDDKTFPGIPLMMSYKEDKSSNYFFWNDDASTETEEKSGGSGKAHSKGGLIFNKNSGFLLSHSLPRFPRRNDKNEIEPEFPSNAGMVVSRFSVSGLYVVGNGLPLNSTSEFSKKLSPSIIGGELEFQFENKDKEIYKPVEFDLICFDGDYKHKINKFSGEGIRGTLIMNIEKI